MIKSAIDGLTRASLRELRKSFKGKREKVSSVFSYGDVRKLAYDLEGASIQIAETVESILPRLVEQTQADYIRGVITEKEYDILMRGFLMVQNYSKLSVNRVNDIVINLNSLLFAGQCELCGCRTEWIEFLGRKMKTCKDPLCKNSQFLEDIKRQA